jgi:hypothetical protein
MTDRELKRLERSTYRAATDSGLWDMFLAGVFAMLAVGPLLSVHLGDFWSTAVFIPFWAGGLWAIHYVQTRVIRPRLGVVEFSAPRKRRLATLGVVMLVANVLALILGIFAATRTPTIQDDIVPISFSLVLLGGFSTAAFVLGIPRVFAYGVLLATAPPVGEFLFRRGYASHHGFPVVFGLSAAIILVSGIVRFLRFLPPPPADADLRSPGPDHRGADHE